MACVHGIRVTERSLAAVVICGAPAVVQGKNRLYDGLEKGCFCGGGDRINERTHGPAVWFH